MREAVQLEETAVIDSAPVPCVGYKRSKQARDVVGHATYGACLSKALKYFGSKFHGVFSLADLIMDFLRTPANSYDNQPVVELLKNCAFRLQRPLGDGAYNDAAL